MLNYEQPSPYIVETSLYSDEYKTPVLTAGQTFILGYTNEDFGIYKASKNNPVIIFDDFTTAIQWVDFNFKVKSSAMKILKSVDNSKYNTRYVFFAMQCIFFEVKDHSRQWISKYSKIKIPLPPLSTQQKIVSILDRFNALCTDLTSGLPAEIEARKKQYEYYRDKLLTFNKL